MSLFDVEEEKTLELIEPEVVELPKKPRKKKTTLKEQFANILARQVMVDTLSDKDKICSICGIQMVPIGTEVIRSEIIYIRPKMGTNRIYRYYLWLCLWHGAIPISEFLV